VESTRDREERAFRSRPFAMFRTLTLMDTEAIHLLAVLEHKQAGNSTHHYLRRLHNYALHLGWLLAPVMADAAWPEIRKKKFTAIAEEEHLRIVAREQSTGYYAVDPNLIDADIFNASTNLQGVIVAVSHNWSDGVSSTLRYAYAMPVNGQMATPNVNQDLQIGDIKQYQLFQADLMWKF
jgi:hypothetical protein